MSYHLQPIPQGTYGEISKIIEELYEARDAIEQGVKIMVLCELADIWGAVDGYMEVHGIPLYSLTVPLLNVVFDTGYFEERGWSGWPIECIQMLKSNHPKHTIYEQLGIVLYCIKKYLAAEFPGITMRDIHEMADVTARAFAAGHRKPKEVK